MSRILITSGPTRQYLDPVRYLSNASSGQMGLALAEAALAAGFEVTVVSGPVQVTYPKEARVIPVITTDEMMEAVTAEFPDCVGLIGAAAPCDYRPIEVADHKIRKTGQAVHIKLIETPDIVATIGAQKRPDQWTVGFALETEDARFRAIGKLQRKNCDLVVLNGVQAIDSQENEIEILGPEGQVLIAAQGPKAAVADVIVAAIQQHLTDPQESAPALSTRPKTKS